MSTEKLTVRLGDHVEILSGFAFSSSYFDMQEGLPLVRIRDLNSETTETRFRGPFDTRFLLSNGDVLVGMDGDFAVVRWSGGAALLNQRVCRVRAKGSLHDGFLFRTLSPIVQQIHQRTAATTVRHLSTKDLERAVLDLPPLSEQQKIAEILDTVDEAIRKTEQIIAKLKQVKQGLLHDLLTRGIDDNGELRDPERHPEQFKDSPLGRIPEAWEVKTLSQIGDIVTGTTPPSGDRRAWGDELPFVTPAEVSTDGVVLPTERKLSAEGRRYVRELPGDVVLIVCIGSTLGKVALAKMPCATNQQINAVVCFPGYKPSFISGVVRQHVTQLHRWAGLQAVPIVNKTQCSQVMLPVPVFSEQAEIARRIEGLARRFDAEVMARKKLRLLKQGLMEDLLTGKVRVTNLLE